MKIWIGGITNSLDVIPLIEQSINYVDGMIFTVDDKSNKDLIHEFDKIKQKYSNFYYLIRKFAQAHDWRANDWLHSGFIKNGDYVCIMDSTDRFNESFIYNLKNKINEWNQNNINSIFLDRLFIFKFTGHQYFESSPHWGVLNLLNNTLSLSNNPQYKRENYIINTRDILRYGIIHPIKYFCEYKRSNATQLLYQQFGNEAWMYHESERVKFQITFEKISNLDCTVENLVQYINEGIKNKNLPQYLIDYIELEVNLQDLVRFYILKQDFINEITKNRFNWSFKKFYFEGKIDQNINDGYIGIFNQYRLKQNRGME